MSNLQIVHKYGPVTLSLWLEREGEIVSFDLANEQAGEKLSLGFDLACQIAETIRDVQLGTDRSYVNKSDGGVRMINSYRLARTLQGPEKK